MTGAEFSGVDIDLLADYVGGALDGTPDEAVVTALIAENPAWRDAHTRLAGGVAAVTGQLHALGSVAEPMPADVFARLDAALGSAAMGATVDRVVPAADHGAVPAATASIDSPSSGATAGPAAMEPGTDGAAPERHLVAVPSGSRGRRARRLRWAAAVGIAAGVLAFVGFGLQQQFTGGDSEDSSAAAGSAAETQRVLPGQDLALPNGSPQILQSGTDYRRDTLSGAGTMTMLAPEPPREQVTDSSSRKAVPGGGALAEADPVLNRLRVPEALRACIDAIAARHGAGEVTPQTIDFARYDGAPAVIVQFTAAGESWVWAAGPACGTPGVGADTRASVKVG